jgi:hypothetical protein
MVASPAGAAAVSERPQMLASTEEVIFAVVKVRDRPM